MCEALRRFLFVHMLVPVASFLIAFAFGFRFLTVSHHGFFTIRQQQCRPRRSPANAILNLSNEYKHWANLLGEGDDRPSVDYKAPWDGDPSLSCFACMNNSRDDKSYSRNFACIPPR
ncbi:hypothetical protein HHK36_015867 [Tetracentron sinense]|uniref:Uncharacterized protein n=1 Tax=Tetracentron sinense TaxID=13715 RepID=A0A835DH77_TETSI|nr:hypothetical protein HHK36_015867 [Tetracentron sinense]